ncbi:MAG TPA: polysaccharide deacetylase family protein [Roseiarcus sp.]|jgi:peptidoglycan/xylan/chitin deacetylase (PgdA/CDA1 family)
MPIITTSFDNGPDPDVTPQVLDTLRRHDIRSSFFVLGERLRDRRKLAERAHAEGHWIGNHTYNHVVPLGTSAEAGMSAGEITRTQALIGELAHERRFFRPLGGGGGGQLDERLLNDEALKTLVEGQYTCVLWNVVPGDWAYPEGWVERALRLCFETDHALMVLHDLPTGAMAGLDRFLSAAKDRGAVFQQDFPEACVPLEQGRISGPIESYVATGAGA